MSKEINVVKKSIYWASIEKALQFLLSFFVTTILAREIGPSAFGLVALAIVFEFLFLYLMESWAFPSNYPKKRYKLSFN